MREKSAQAELPGLPKIDPLAEKALEYLNAKDDLAKKKEDLDKIKNTLISAFIDLNKKSIRVGTKKGARTISYLHKESNKIIITKG